MEYPYDLPIDCPCGGNDTNCELCEGCGFVLDEDAYIAYRESLYLEGRYYANQED